VVILTFFQWTQFYCRAAPRKPDDMPPRVDPVGWGRSGTGLPCGAERGNEEKKNISISRSPQNRPSRYVWARENFPSPRQVFLSLCRLIERCLAQQAYL
jgi:hypothetical protein